MSAPAPAPRSSQVLLELGPETAPLPKQGPGSVTAVSVNGQIENDSIDC